MLKEHRIDQTELEKIQQQLLKQVKLLEGKKLVIVGDVGLDEYVMGEASRISPEAPVPVVAVNQQSTSLGLAANVAQNVASLGGEAKLVAVVGEDAAADELRAMLRNASVSPEYLIVDSERPTTRKMRVMVEHHHIVRVDYEKKRFLPSEVEERLFEVLAREIPNSDGVIIEDYAKGVLSENCCQRLIDLSHKYGKMVFADPNTNTPLSYYRGADVFTPNRDEAIRLSGLNIDELREKKESLLEAGRAILNNAQLANLVLTRGKEGMSLFNNGDVTHMPTYARQVFDVTGAGDTVIAALALAWTSGLDPVHACVLANFAAGVVVGKVGSVTCTTEDLVKYIESHSDE